MSNSSDTYPDLLVIRLDTLKKILVKLPVESKDTNELFHKTETDSQTSKTNLWLPKEKGGRRDKLRVWD